MTDFAKHLIEVGTLVGDGTDPVPLFERKAPDGDWEDVTEFEDLVKRGYVYRYKPRSVVIGDQEFELPECVEGAEYWAANIWSPMHPSKVTYAPGNSALRHQAEVGLLNKTKKDAVGMAKAICYWLSEGGDK